MSCPIEIVHSGVSLTPLSLFTLITSITTPTHEHPLLFRREDNEFSIDFHPSLSVLTPDEIHKRSVEPSYFCHFQGFNERGFQAWLSACEPDQIEMMLRTSHGSFRLEHVNGTFVIVSDGQDDCDTLWRTMVKRAGGGIKMISPLDPFREHALPPYFKKYANLFTKRRYVEFAMIGEYSLLERYDNDVEKTKNRMLTVLHFTNSLYDSLNIEFRLVHLSILNSSSITNLDFSTSWTLFDSFGKFLETDWLKRASNGVHYDTVNIMTAKLEKDSTAVGIAKLSAMCDPKISYSWIRDTDERLVVIHKLAHELGHNLGIYHDREGYEFPVCECVQQSCVMGANDIVPALHWSNCSLEYLDRFYKSGGDHCMLNVPGVTLEPASCGNGVVDDGEDCDCGPWGCITHDCCNNSTCKFQEHAQCAFGYCCELDTCSKKTDEFLCSEENLECYLDVDSFYDETKCNNDYECEKPVIENETLACGDGFVLQSEIDHENELTWTDVSSVTCLDREFKIGFENEEGFKTNALIVGIRCARERIESTTSDGISDGPDDDQEGEEHWETSTDHPEDNELDE